MLLDFGIRSLAYHRVARVTPERPRRAIGPVFPREVGKFLLTEDLHRCHLPGRFLAVVPERHEMALLALHELGRGLIK